MNRVQSLQLRQSEVREGIGAVLDVPVEERSDEQRETLATLTREARSLEGDLQAALLTQESEPEAEETRTGEGDAEERERRELRDRFRVGKVIGALMGDRIVRGAEAEYAEAVGLAAGKIPVSVWESGREARAVTPAPANVDTSGHSTTTAPFVPAIFDASIAPFLGIEMPSAGTGDQAYPVLSTSVTAGVRARGAAAPETSGAFRVGTVQPRRVTGSFRIRVEDAARLSGLETALRTNLSMVMSDQVDNQALNGTADAGGEDGEVRGLLAILTDPTAPAAGAETWQRYNAAFASHVDGLMSTGPGTVRALVGPHTLRHMLQAFFSDNNVQRDAESWAAYAARVYGGVRASRRIADPAQNIQQAVIRRGNPAGDRVAVMPVWDSMTIRDIYSGAAEGEIVVTAYMLVGDVVLLRPDAFVQDSFRLA